jgi:hypothetical protein
MMTTIDIPPKKWTFDIGEHVGVIDHFEPELGIRWKGVVNGQDQMGDQYFTVMPDKADRCGRRLQRCEDKADMRKLPQALFGEVNAVQEDHEKEIAANG